MPFGVPAIDRMLDGGLMPHRPYLLVGPSGTGKTTLALEFLREGIRRGEPGLYVTVEDPPNEVRNDHRALGIELDRVDVFDAIPDVMRYEHIPFKDISSVRDVVPFRDVPNEIRKTPELTSVEVTIPALEQILRTEVVRRGYVRLVIDSLTALQYFCMKGIEPMSGAQSFLRFLSQLRTTSLLTVESPLEDAETAERSLARGEIRLFRWELDGVTVRAIGVEKFRGSAHDVRLHPYRIGPRGVDINLDLTISRDTRRLVEPALAVVAPQLAEPALAEVAETPLQLLGSVSAQVRDLVAVGVDVTPVRTEVQAALEAVRAGRPEESEAHLARVSSLAISLAESLLQSPPAERKLSKAANEAFQRIVQRADATRGGVPPTRLPTGEVLAGQLRSVIDQLPPEAASADRSGATLPTPRAGAETPGTVPEGVPAPAAPRSASPPPSPPAVRSLGGPTSPPPAGPSPRREPTAEGEAPPGAEPGGARVVPGADASASPATVASAPVGPLPGSREPSTPAAVPTPSRAPTAREGPVAPPSAMGRRSSRGPGAPGPYPAPPRRPSSPLVDGEPMPRASARSGSRPGSRAAPAGGAPSTSEPVTNPPLGGSREPPPLPTLVPWKPPEPAEGAVVGSPGGPSAPAPPSDGGSSLASPSPRRKRAGGSKRPPAARVATRGGADTAPDAEGAPGGTGTPAPARRKTTRKRKAPPVVAAMPETLPRDEAEPSGGRSPEPSPEAPSLPPESPP